MMNSPACLAVESTEKGIMHGMSNLYDGSADVFTESLFVADFFTERNTAYKDDLLAQDGYPKDVTWSGQLTTMKDYSRDTLTIFLP